MFGRSSRLQVSRDGVESETIVMYACGGGYQTHHLPRHLQAQAPSKYTICLEILILTDSLASGETIMMHVCVWGAKQAS